ncbi:Bug family tripartite tricarboxylate transporter substrate binding protein [Roseococcus pinisoli]|uniref:Tripartite tricarboxylate transporter substrate binding protein n=1 Tax=Roseococcus pinisoli TaxID=2835040 RepID=A0ABS5QFJ2_9PROT|nr:tripartite tricarboxylate transporter substrate binding protein [Roseococcus pinisoli]MBS7812436.1 tripartite tricarboxylate transporter substrate binding protein [Roseococcus pinisoli]
MMLNFFRRGLAAAMLLTGVGAAAQEFPQPGRPLMFVSGFPAGTAIDIYGRLIQERAQREFGVPMVIDIRAGASGNIGMEYVARAAPDGHTIILATSAMMAINPAVFPRMTVDPQTDLVPILGVFDAPNFMTVSTEMRPQFTTCQSVIDAARQRPGQLNYASTGAGASTHLAGAQFASVLGLDLVHVPYRGGPFAMTALYQGAVDVFFYQTGPVIEFYREGRVRLLAVTSGERVAAVPEVPTVAEACNLPGFDSTTWYALMAPARTPPAIRNRLTEVFTRIANEPELRERITAMGFAPNVQTPEATRARLARDAVTWRGVVERTGARAE